MSYLRCGNKLPSGKGSGVYVYEQASNPGTLAIMECTGLGRGEGSVVVTIEELLYVADEVREEQKKL